jgi:hypothetical protein
MELLANPTAIEVRSSWHQMAKEASLKVRNPHRRTQRPRHGLRRVPGCRDVQCRILAAIDVGTKGHAGAGAGFGFGNAHILQETLLPFLFRLHRLPASGLWQLSSFGP